MRHVLLLLLTSSVLGWAGEILAPPGLPLGPSYEGVFEEHEDWKPGLELPEGIKIEKTLPPLSSPLVVESLKGEITRVSPKSIEPLKAGDALQVWDRLVIGAKGELVLKDAAGIRYTSGSGGLIQLLKTSGGDLCLRLLRGKMRVDNSGAQVVRVETLNAMVYVPSGKTDLIISAMNTLVAPREGESVPVKTKLAYRKVPVGVYGLVMADGSLLYSGGKAKK